MQSAGDDIDAVTYRCRRSVLEHEATWTLTSEALERTEDSAPPQRWPYEDVVELRLSYAPSRFDSSRFRCNVTAGSGQDAVIMSTSYAGIAEFEDRAATYTPFVRELVQRVARAAPDCRLRAGRRLWVYVAEHAFLLSMLLLLVTVLELVGGFPLGSIVTVKLFIIACYVPIAIKYARRNLPRRIEPADIPPDILP